MYNKIKNECSDIISFYKKHNKYLYRGFFTKKTNNNILIIKPKNNRKPIDINILLHNYIDNKLKENFKWKPRSEGVFTTHDKQTTKIYGSTYIFLPINNFKYIYNQNIFDLYMICSLYKIFRNYSINDYIEDYLNNKLKNNNMKNKIKHFLNNIIQEYTNKNLKNTFKSCETNSITKYYPEVIFKCKKYYLIKEKLINELL